MANSETNVLLFCANQNDVQLVDELLQIDSPYTFQVECVKSVSSGLKQLKKQPKDIILLDSQLSDDHSLRTLEKISSATPETPIIILTENRDTEIATKALRAGAQDYLIKGEFTSDILIRAIRYAIERKQAHEALRRSEARFRVIAENIGDIIWQMTLAQKFTYVSPSIYQMFGYTQEEWIGTHLSEHASPKAFQKMLGVIVFSLKEFATFTDVIFESEMIRKDGTEFPVEICGRLILNENKIPVGLQGVTRDITERKKTERQIRLQAAALRSAANAIVITDHDGTIEWINPAFEILTG